MINVVSIPDRPPDGLRTRLLPPTPVSARGAGRLYLFYETSRSEDSRLADADGHMLAELRCFATREGAREWVRRDVAARSGGRRPW